MIRVLFILLLFFFDSAMAHEFRVELSSASTLYNFFQIPGDTGTRVDLPKGGSLFAYRVSGAYHFNEYHAVRLLIAPFQVSYLISPGSNISFNDTVFGAGAPATATYKFNSYRVGYIYTINPESKYLFRIGFVAKVRDAFIQLKDSNQTSTKSNVGFVPLLNIGAKIQISEAFDFVFDLDGLAAPQGRAFDGSAEMLWNYSESFGVSGGLRLLEGGAQNNTVNNFGFFSFYFLAVKTQF